MKNKSDINYWIHIKIIIYYLQLVCSLSQKKKKEKKKACSLHCEATILHTLRFVYRIISYSILIFLGFVLFFYFFNSLLIISYI